MTKLCGETMCCANQRSKDATQVCHPDQHRQGGCKVELILPGLLALSLMTSPVAIAQSDNAQSIKVGEADFTPAVRIDYQSNSNSYLTPDGEISANGIVVSPQFEFVADRRLLTLVAGYSGKFASFSEDDLGFDDHRLYAVASANPATRHRIRGNFSVEKLHDEFGTDLTLGQGRDTGTKVEEIDTILDVRYTFGAAQAQGNLVGGLRLYDRSYQNRGDITDGRGYSIVAPYARFAYRLSADARVFSELRLRQLGFEDKNLNRSETILSLGLGFSETGKTGGEARLGITQANYDTANKDDATFLSANVSLYYEPNGISRFDLFASRDLSNVDLLNARGVNSDAIDDDLSVRWTYQWSAFVTTRASLATEIRRRDCPTTGSTTTAAGFEVGLFPRRWIEVGAGVTAGQRSGDKCSADQLLQLDYDRQTFNLFTRVTL